ncbi:MAG: response regulator [Sandaracinaceae bacterium]|nr:response regulator [Sandaracinaceae bacterium]
MDLEDVPTRVERIRPRVLVVDDDDAIRVCIERTLVRYGYLVAVAAGVEEALGRARTWRPDVLLVDRRLRDGDGLELAGRVRAEFGPDAPRVLVCSGDGSLHGWRVVPKPFHLHELVEAVRSSLSVTASRG